MALAAQGQDKGAIFCDKCFTPSPKGSEFCQNCGAALSSKPGAEGSDVVVYPQLAQVNLLRMRSRFKEAEETCLAILHQYPHNLSANVLMGDLAAEQGNLDQAVQWYELALDIDPDSAALKTKLEAARTKNEDTVVQTVVQELGLPPEKPKTLLVALISLAAILLLGLGAWFAYKSAKASTDANKIDSPILIGQGTAGGGGSAGPSPVGASGLDKKVQPVSEDDLALTKLLAAKTSQTAFFVDARFDLATDGIVITYNAPQDKDERDIGAKLATESFDLVKENMQRDVAQVALRAIRDKKLFYSAVVKRDAYEATQATDWQDAHKEDYQAFLKAVLSDEKHAPPPAGDKPAATGGETGTDQGGGEVDTAGETTGGSPTTPGTTGSPPTTTGSPPPATTGATGGSSTGSTGGNTSTTGADNGAGKSTGD